MQRFMDKMTNVVMNYSEVEAKVREATNDDTWGPHGSLMTEISKYTFTYEHYPEVMSMVWKRMFETKKNWRRTYKSLLLLHYLIRNGSERVVTSAREHIYDMKPLEEYTFRDEHGKDQGINVRQKAKEIISFLQDDERLREARKAAKITRDKYVGYSSEELQDKYSDRYDSEPRSRSHHHFEGKSKEDSTGGHYDEDPRGPIGRYTDENGNVAGRFYSDEDGSSRPYRDVSPKKEEEEEEEEEKKEEEQEKKGRETSPLRTSIQKVGHPSPSLAHEKKSGQPSKLVDLGAAAIFASQAESTKSKPSDSNPPQVGTGEAGDPLLDIFGGFSSSATADQTQLKPMTTEGGQSGFANFESAFMTKPDEPQTVGSPAFGDFSSFQSSATVQPQLQPQLQPQQPTPTDFGVFQSGAQTQTQVSGVWTSSVSGFDPRREESMLTTRVH